MGLGLLVTSCELFEYNPYDTRYSNDTGINQTNISRIESLTGNSDTLRFVLMGDTQRYYDETKAFVNHVNQRTDIDFVIHGGDITDFGTTKEFEWVHDLMKRLTVPYVALIGNHDVLGHGKDVYREVYGPFNFSFVVKRTRFVCLNTNALEFDYATPVPDFGYMRQFIGGAGDADQTIVVMHAPPYDDQFNNNSAPMFNAILEAYPNLRFCLHAHQHVLKQTDFFGNGIMYYGCDDLSGRNYLVFTVTRDRYSYTVEHF